MKKRILSLFLALCMLSTVIIAMPITAMAQSGTCGENLTWVLDDDTLTISGTGVMEGWIYSSLVPWNSSSKSIKSVIIGNGVTTIGNSAFSDCESLTSITIPNSVTSIGAEAFAYCRGLTSITIPNSVTTIGDRAFFCCEGLKSITIPSSVTTISAEAFFYCKKLTSVVISNGVTTIGDSAFYSCWDLMSIAIPNSVTKIDNLAFSRCTQLGAVYYYGSDDNWESINTGYGNDYLLDAWIYCNATLPTVKYEIDGTILAVDISARYIPQTAKVCLAAYDLNGKMIAMHIPTVNKNSAKLELPLENIDYIKALVWDDNLKPLSSAKNVTINRENATEQ